MDLFDNMKVDSIVWNKQKLTYKRDFDAVFISFPKELMQNASEKVRFYYSGKPKVAKNAPWDGGFVFKKDSNKNHHIAVAVQGTGASLWFPVKDSQTDEPNNGASVKVAVPNGLMNVSNGRFKGSEDLGDGYTRWDWEVINPINNYTITVNIADYVHIHDKLDDLDLDYYVLRENEEKARKHFDEDVKPMMNCFQTKFGKYPFWEDGYKLVETPYLGMEHQSAVAYGNKYKKGYMGFDLSGTGVGMFFDYITIHETGHEWFGNSVTSKDIADMWIHEGFTTYSETVFIECMKGYEPAMKYINGQAKNVRNDKPIIGQFGVNNEGSGDMYAKAGSMIHNIRHAMNNDSLFRSILIGLNKDFYHQTVTTQQIENYISNKSGINFSKVFDQYLRTIQIPVFSFQYDQKEQILTYQWKNCIAGFDMPLHFNYASKHFEFLPTDYQPQKRLIKIANFDTKKFAEEIKKQYYVEVIIE